MRQYQPMKKEFRGQVAYLLNILFPELSKRDTSNQQAVVATTPQLKIQNLQNRVDLENIAAPLPTSFCLTQAPVLDILLTMAP
jgi:hypothetical protein